MPELPSLSEIISAIITFAEPYFRDYGYPIVLVAAILEHMVFFGWIVPGGTMIVIATFYAQQGALDLRVVGALALAGFVVGDGLDYLLGRLWGHRVIRVLDYLGLWRPKDELVHRHLGKFLPLAYLGALARSAALITTGVSRVSFLRVLPISILANIVLVGIYMLIGYLAGQHLEGAIQMVERVLRGGQIVLVVVIAVVAAVVFFRLQPKLLPGAGDSRVGDGASGRAGDSEAGEEDAGTRGRGDAGTRGESGRQ